MRRFGKGHIDDYAYTNEAEYFAVLSEYFFEAPDVLAKKEPSASTDDGIDVPQTRVGCSADYASDAVGGSVAIAVSLRQWREIQTMLSAKTPLAHGLIFNHREE